LPPHSGDHRRNAACTSQGLCSRALLTSTTVTSSWNRHITDPSTHLQLPTSRRPWARLSSGRRSLAVCVTTSHWLLFRVRDSLDAVPRSQATNRPITRSSKTKPREQSCNNTIVSRQDTGRAVSPLARNQAASSGVVQIPRRCKVVHSATQTSALVQASLLSSTGTQQRKQTTRASNVACSSAIALEAVSIRPNDLNYPFRPFAARRPFTSEHQLISSALHVLRKRLSSHNAQLRLEHFLGFRFTIRRPTRFTHKS
jgi:hypothetical protein